MLLLAIVITGFALVEASAPAIDAIGEHRVPVIAKSVDYFSNFRP